MPAILLALLRGLAAAWGLLVKLMPFLGKIAPWLAASFPSIFGWLRATAGKVAADVAEDVLRGAFAVAMRLAGMIAWGVFLGVFFTGLNGLAIREIAMSNPFSGFPAAIMFLVNAGFPVKFAFALVQAYIVWKFTVAYAAQFMAAVCKWFFGF